MKSETFFKENNFPNLFMIMIIVISLLIQNIIYPFLQSWGLLTATCRPNLAQHPFFVRSANKIAFTILKDWKFKRRIFHDTWKLYEIQIPECINVLLEDSYGHSFTYHLWIILCYRAELSRYDRHYKAPQTYIFTMQLSTVKVCWALP